MKLIFASLARADYLYWQDTDARLLMWLNGLIAECRRHPFAGTGKPEALKGDLSGFWSRRITAEHRLVYRVSGTGAGQALEIVQCRYHH